MAKHVLQFSMTFLQIRSLNALDSLFIADKISKLFHCLCILLYATAYKSVNNEHLSVVKHSVLESNVQKNSNNLTPTAQYIPLVFVNGGLGG